MYQCWNPKLPRSICGAVQGREPPLITPDEMLDSVRVVEAGYRALAAASWVTVGR